MFFEDHDDWSNANANSTEHTEGDKSIEVISNYWVLVESAVMSSLGIPLDKVSVDVKLPYMPSWGEITFIVKVPSRGIYYRQLETVPMSTLTPGQFGTVSFVIPQDVSDALNGTYSDLILTVVLNSDPMNQPILLDNMRIVEIPDEPDSDDPPAIVSDTTVRDFIFTLPGGVQLSDAFMTASESMRLSNAVTVANENAVVSNMGTGRIETNTDVSLGGDVYAMGDVLLSDRVHIGGFLRADGEVEVQSNVVIEEGDQDVAVTLGRVVQWTTEWPAATKSLFIDGTQTAELMTGSYSEVHVQPNGTLIVNPGVYYIQNLVVEKDGKVMVNGNGSAVVLYVKDSLSARGQMIHSQSSEDLLIAYGGYGTVDLDAPFGGTVVAPNAQVRLAPLNGAIHEGSFVGRTIDAEANNEIVLKPFAHWDYLLGMDACTPAAAFVDCTGIATWQQQEYITGDRVTDGARVYTVHDDSTRTLAGTSPDFAPATGLRWQEAWAVSGTCDENGEAKEVLSWFNPSDIAFYFAFDSILHGDTANYIEDIDNSKAEVVGSDALIRYNTTRRGCTSDSAVALNTELIDGYLPGGEITSVQFTKPVDTESMGIFLELKPYSINSQTFITNSNASGTQLAIGYSAQSGLFVKVGTHGETHYAGKDKSLGFTMGEWHNIGAAIVDNGDGTSTIQMVIDSAPMFGSDTEDGITVTGSLNITEDSKWVIGAYNDTALGTVHTPLTGEVGAVLAIKNFPKEGSMISLSKSLDYAQPGDISYADDAASVQNDVSSVGKEASINTSAPEIPMPDPMAGLKEIGIPEINPQGSANVYYPIEVPKAVVGPTPSLGLRYDSSKKDGNAGIGWNLVASRIEMDTSDEGIPEYCGPSDKYPNLVFDGKKLVFWKEDNGDFLYRAKKEKEFYVVRYTADNYMLVEYPDGRVRFYGDVASSRVARPEEPDDIFRWYLTREVDSSGNAIYYAYAGGDVWEDMVVEPYLTQILYGQNSRYGIDFDWVDREDFRISGRSGFLIKNAKRLGKVFVTSADLVYGRVINLVYSDAALTGKILTSVSETIPEGDELNRLNFDYAEVGYDYDTVPLGELIDDDFAYFGEPGAQFDSFLNRSKQVEHDVDGYAYTKSYLKSGPMDWNGDGAVDYMRNIPKVEGDENTGYGHVGLWLSDGQTVPTRKNLETQFAMLNTMQCRYPFEVDGDSGELETLPIQMSQTLNEESGMHFTNAGLYDFNGDGTKDLVHSCNDKLHVIFNRDGDLSGEIVTYPLSNQFDWRELSQLVTDDYFENFETAGRQFENQIIESATLGIGSRTVEVSEGGVSSDGVLLQYVRTGDIRFVEALDINGDHLLDRVLAIQTDVLGTIGNDGYEYYVQHNHGPEIGFSNSLRYLGAKHLAKGFNYSKETTFALQGIPFTINCTSNRAIDLNGDALIDLAYFASDTDTGEGNELMLQFNTGRFEEANAYTWNVGPNEEFLIETEGNIPELEGILTAMCATRSCLSLSTGGEGVEGYGPEPIRNLLKKDLRDMNGDGFVDIVKIHDSGLWVAINTGNEFLQEQKWLSLHDPDDEIEIPFLSFSWTSEADGGELNDGTEFSTKTTTTEDFLRDCNGDGVPDFIVPGDDFITTRRCRINRTGKLNRLVGISNQWTGRNIQLGYTDGVKLDTASVTNSGKHRTVLSSVRTSNYHVSDEPVEIFEYSYSHGIEDKTNQHFLGWEKIESRKYVEGYKDTKTNWIDKKRFEFSSVEGLDDWGINDVPDEYLNGTMRAHETGYSVGGVYKTLSREEFVHEDVPVLNATEDVRYTFVTEQYTSRFNEAGECLYGQGPSGTCHNKEVKSTELVFDKDNGFITKKEVSDTGDPQVTYDDKFVTTEFALLPTGYFIRPIQRATYQDGAKTNRVAYVSYDDYDADGYLTKETRWVDGGNDLVVNYTYKNGLPETVTNAAGHKTEYVYAIGTNGLGRNIAYTMQTILPDGTTTSESYDHFGHLVQTVANDGASQFYEYDFIGRLSHSGNHISGEMHIQYDYFKATTGGVYIFGVRAVADQSGYPLEIVKLVDAMGRSVQIKQLADIDGDAGWILSGALRYDELGRVVKKGQSGTADISQPAKEYSPVDLVNPMVYEYDDLGRITHSDSSDGQSATIDRETISGWTDTANGIALSQTLIHETITDQLSNKRSVYSDIYGNVLVDYRIDPTGSQQIVTQKIIYDALESEVIAPSGESSHVYKDTLGRVNRIITPDAGETVYHYGIDGKLASVQRVGKVAGGESAETTYYYDEHGRIEYVDNVDNARDMKFIYYSESADVWNRYKLASIAVGFSNPDETTSADLSTQYKYGKDWVTKTRTVVPKGGDGGNTGLSASMTYTVDAYGRTMSVEYPDGEKVNYAYDRAGRLKRVIGEFAYINWIRYNKDGQRKFVQNGNGVEREYDYYSETQKLKNMRVSDRFAPERGDLLNLTYDYDDRRLLSSVTNTTAVDDESFALGYLYDSFGRISEAGAAGGSQNQWAQTNTYTFDEATRMISSSENADLRTTQFLAHTSAPEIVTTTTAEGNVETQTYTYNNFGERIGATTIKDGALTDSRTLTFNSDGTLANVQTLENDVSFNYDVQGNRVYKKVNNLEKHIREETLYLFNLYSQKGAMQNKHISDGKHVVATKLEGEKYRVFYFTPDHLGSTIMVTNRFRNIISKSLYDPFGKTMYELKNGNDADENERKFTNQIYDEETGLYYFNARYYDPKNGVFISPDPAMSGLNHYAYANGNPLLFVDPTGLDDVDIDCDYSWESDMYWDADTMYQGSYSSDVTNTSMSSDIAGYAWDSAASLNAPTTAPEKKDGRDTTYEMTIGTNLSGVTFTHSYRLKYLLDNNTVGFALTEDYSSTVYSIEAGLQGSFKMYNVDVLTLLSADDATFSLGFDWPKSDNGFGGEYTYLFDNEKARTLGHGGGLNWSSGLSADGNLFDAQGGFTGNTLYQVTAPIDPILRQIEYYSRPPETRTTWEIIMDSFTIANGSMH